MKKNIKQYPKKGVLLVVAALLFFLMVPYEFIYAGTLSKDGNWEYEAIKSSKDKSANMVSASNDTNDSAGNKDENNVTDDGKEEGNGDSSEKEDKTEYDIRLLSYKGSSSKLTIPKTVDGHNVSELASYCFSCNTDLKKVVIPACIVKVPVNTFDSCTSLSEIYFKGTETVTSAKFASASSDALKVFCFKDSATYKAVHEGYDVETLDGSLKLDKEKATIVLGDTLQLKATASDEKAKLSWSSDNETVAAVSKEGLVTTKAAGKAVVSVKTKISGREYVASCSISVKKPALEVKELTITKGFSAKIGIKTGKNSKNWTTSDKTIATVDKNGNVKGLKVGNCTVKTKIGGVTLKCKITVRSNMYKASYYYKIKDMPADALRVQVINAYFSGEKFIVKCRVYNTTKYEYKGFSSLKITGYRDDKELFTWEKKSVSAPVSPNKAKNFTITFNTKELYKYLDLNTVSLKLSGEMKI